MQNPRVRTLSLAVLFGTVFLVPGCDSAGNLIGPENQLEVTSAVDQFQFQLTALDQVTDSRTYDWENTGTAATIDVTQAITAGSAMLTVRDANGDVMYQQDLASGMDATTPTGIAGTWQIEVQLTNTTGTFNFRVQKAT